MKVVADARKLGDGFDPETRELRRIADPGQQEQARRVDRAGAQDDVGGGMSPLGPTLVVVLDTGAAIRVDGEPVHVRTQL